MARFTFGAGHEDDVLRVESTETNDLIKGRSLIKLIDFGPNRIELGLSGEVKLRISASPTGLEVNSASTQEVDASNASAKRLGTYHQLYLSGKSKPNCGVFVLLTAFSFCF